MSFGGRGKTGGDPAPAGELAVAAVGARVHVDVVIPGTTVAGKMRLLSNKEELATRHEARQACAAVGLPWPASETSLEFYSEFAVRSLAIAVRSPANLALALAPLDDWQELSDRQVNTLWARYQDLEAELDPLAKAELTTADFASILDAAKKKDAALLRSFGSPKLAAFAITSAVPPSS